MTWESSDRRQRLPPGWSSRIVPAVKQRDGYRCTRIQPNGTRCPGPADEVDHIRPGDDHRMINLASLCVPHHRIKTQDEARRAAAAAAQRRRDAKRRHAPHPGLSAPTSVDAASPRGWGVTPRAPGAGTDPV